MGRKKIEPENKKIHFGVSIHPELAKLIDKYSKNDNKSISKFIEDIMIEHFKKENNKND